jgi:SAM-dependent methyltransferase
MTVYGKYSLGSGGILNNNVWEAFDSPGIVKDYKVSISRDLDKSGIPVEKLAAWDVMDVGTGRQAVAFYSLGAKHVTHYDLSQQNVEQVGQFIASKSIHDRMKSQCCDLVTTELPTGKFDFIYLNGVAQHFSDVGQGLSNCIKALKKGGYLWLYFYRSGTFLQFVIYMIRDLIADKKNDTECFTNALLLYSDDATPNLFVSNLMDDLFVEYIHLFTPMDYVSFLAAHGMTIVSSSKLDPYGKAVEHHYAHPSVVLVCRKDEITNQNCGLLSPKLSVNQLDIELYDSQEVVEIINLYMDVKKLALAKDTPIVMNIAFRLYLFVSSMDNSLSSKKYSDYMKLKIILENTLRLLKAS